eukprot:CAMPEP_0114634888 /NCGR_PEP_ID=MMETSP0168-20121206/16205_1 /TAXON_ID=95228 ORGANISM="Vannella sp., Strain DIVA3 517/6/12" /NCGR_SAMPLE_ID=MMETSP0168 /ASSEMBLY_ACC=CAM_ASM_000044 /LENGTH=146 /DNA_ID=CAMNT_0001846589 /DNA_START=109 /DNA_END=546 /DNA_ORIENTATION=-
MREVALHQQALVHALAQLFFELAVHSVEPSPWHTWDDRGPTLGLCLEELSLGLREIETEGETAGVRGVEGLITDSVVPSLGRGVAGVAAGVISTVSKEQLSLVGMGLLSLVSREDSILRLAASTFEMRSSLAAIDLLNAGGALAVS